MSHTARSTLFLAAGASYCAHRRPRLESISLRTGRSVLRANIGNEWSTPDSHTWRSQSNLKNQVKYGGPQELHTMLHSSSRALQLSPVLAVLVEEDERIARFRPSCMRCIVTFSERCRWTKTFVAHERRLLTSSKEYDSQSNDHAATDKAVSSERSRSRRRLHGCASVGCPLRSRVPPSDCCRSRET